MFGWLRKKEKDKKKEEQARRSDEIFFQPVMDVSNPVSPLNPVWDSSPSTNVDYHHSVPSDVSFDSGGCDCGGSCD